MFQGAIGPDGPTGETGLEGKKVRKLSLLKCPRANTKEDFFFFKEEVMSTYLHVMEWIYSICMCNDFPERKVDLQIIFYLFDGSKQPVNRTRTCFSPSTLPLRRVLMALQEKLVSLDHR